MKTKKKSIFTQYINGYKILFIPRSSKTLYVQSVIHSGFINETKETSGINHLLEHVIVDGWKQCKGSCIKYWDNLGKYINASTDMTVMKYYVKGGIENADEMIEYISTITTNPLFTSSTLMNEKKAIIEELQSSSNDSTYDLIDKFNKLFFKEEGLQYSEDWKLQIKNLTHLTISNIKKLFHEYFNPQNALFIVYGDFNTSKVQSLFSKYLIQHNNQKMTYDCFTNKCEFSFIPHEKDTYSVIIGFPCDKLIDHKLLCEDILNNLLFNELRTVHKLVYGIKCALNITQCNTYLTIEFDVSLEKVKITIQKIIYCLLWYKKHAISPVILSSCKKRILYKYRTDYDMMDYYSDYIYSNKTPLTLHQLIQHNHKFTENQFKSTLHEIIQFNKATCVYQGTKDLNLSWNSFIQKI
jgi:predicted Zn-dependent peptidase